MEANELKYNNLLFYKGKVISITMIGEFGIQSNHNGILINAKFDTQDLTPIPLTEEWINKFGFQLDQYVEIESYIDEDYEWDIHLEMEYGERGTLICISSDNINESLNIQLKHIKYVHQFQNLFFALKGKELKLKQS